MLKGRCEIKGLVGLHNRKFEAKYKDGNLAARKLIFSMRRCFSSYRHFYQVYFISSALQGGRTWQPFVGSKDGN